jgi:hypothetical protein
MAIDIAKKHLSPLLKPFLQLPLFRGKFAEVCQYCLVELEKQDLGGPNWATDERVEHNMLLIYSLATLVLAVPGAVVSSLMLIERGRKHREGHTHD